MAREITSRKSSGTGFQFDLAGLHFREVENIVDQVQQIDSVALKHVDILFCSAVRGLEERTSAIPMIEFSGVRISWVIVARKSLLARVARSATAFSRSLASSAS